MILFPAIDLKEGQVVRLLYGDLDAVTVYGEDPGAQAQAFAQAGCDWLHVVDLNGAVEGRPVNDDAVTAIRAAFPGKMQLGGGIRTLDNIRHWLEKSAKSGRKRYKDGMKRRRREGKGGGN